MDVFLILVFTLLKAVFVKIVALQLTGQVSWIVVCGVLHVFNNRAILLHNTQIS